LNQRIHSAEGVALHIDVDRRFLIHLFFLPVSLSVLLHSERLLASSTCSRIQ
jgi:hypothetical protein